MGERSPLTRRERLAAAALLAAAIGAICGFAAGGGGAAGFAARRPSHAAPRPLVDVAARLAELVDRPLPQLADPPAAQWARLERELEVEWARGGLPFTAIDVAAARRIAATLRAPERLASLLDVAAELAHRAGDEKGRDACSAAARAIDPEPRRDSIRAALLAKGATEIDLLAADAAQEPLPAPTAALLGLAQARFGRVSEAVETWEAALNDAPDELLLHRLVAWSLADGDADQRAVARRHLEAVVALAPASRPLREALDALRG